MTQHEVIIETFGYLHGQAPKAMLTLDLREYLRDPARLSDRLREMDGRNAEVQQFVMTTPGATQTLQLAAMFLDHVVPADKGPVTVAIGCGGGKHRAATIGELLATVAQRLGHQVTLIHRDVDKDVVR